jgi:3'-5' exoribonuclease
MTGDIQYLSIRDLKNPSRNKGERFHSVLLLRKITSRTARNNNPFLQVELGDKTGSFSFVCFNDHPLYEPLRQAPEGQIATVEGEIDFYQNRLSPRVLEMVFLSEEDLQRPGLMDNLVETSPENADQMMVELYEFIARLQHPEIKSTVENVFAEIAPAFKESSAAIAMHHAYRHGLLEHTIHMARACERLLPLYPQVDADLAISGCLLHDIGKTLEYVGQLGVKKSRIGILQGHVVLGYRMVRKAGLKAKLDPELLERLEHIVLSHQGEMEWGAAAMAATPEAVFVSMIDNLDAKMGMVQSALRQAQEEVEFSDYLPGLKAPVLTTPPHTALAAVEPPSLGDEVCPPMPEPEENPQPEPCV